VKDNPHEASAWERWKSLAARAATFQARVLLTLFYWLFVTPFGLVVRTFFDPLRMSRSAGGRFTPAGRSDPERQY
jgi:hypothetical protein